MIVHVESRLDIIDNVDFTTHIPPDIRDAVYQKSYHRTTEQHQCYCRVLLQMSASPGAAAQQRQLSNKQTQDQTWTCTARSIVLSFSPSLSSTFSLTGLGLSLYTQQELCTILYVAGRTRFIPRLIVHCPGVAQNTSDDGLQYRRSAFRYDSDISG